MPCHGPTGQGDGPTAVEIEYPLPNFSDVEAHRQLVPLEKFEVIKNGRIETRMPPWRNRLDDTQIWNLASYVWWLGTSPQNITAGEAIYTPQCATCHAEDGSGNIPDQQSAILDLSDPALMAQFSQADLHAKFPTSHPDLTLSEEELWLTLDYIRTFSFAIPQHNGTLSGQVVNRTSNQPQGDLEIILHTIEGNAEGEMFTTQADSQGRYTFTNLSTDHAVAYVVEGSYQDVPYFSQPNVFRPDNAEVTLDLDVYELGNDGTGIRMNRMNYILSFAHEELRVIQFMPLSNDNNQTYVGDNGQTFAFSLPAEAHNVSFRNAAEERFTETAAGYVDTQPIYPGEETSAIVVEYTIPYQEDNLTLEQIIPADINVLNVLLQDLGATLSSEQLQFEENLQFEGNDFARYSRIGIKKGEILRLELSDLNNIGLEMGSANSNLPSNTASAAVANQDWLRWLMLALGGVVLLFVVSIYPQLRSKSSVETDIDPQRVELLLLLAGLDDMFEAGDLDEQVYRQARAKYKTKLTKIIDNL